MGINNITAIDNTVVDFIRKYETEKPNSKFSHLLYSEQKKISSYYCRFVWASNILREKGVINLADIKGFNAIAEGALRSCNARKLKKVADKLTKMVRTSL